MNDRAGLAPKVRVQSVFEVAERLLRAVEQGGKPPIGEVRDLARAVLTADPMTALAWRLLRQPVARLRGSDVAELAAMVLRAHQGAEPAVSERSGRKGGRAC